MAHWAERQALMQSIQQALDILQRARSSYPALEAPCRALQRTAKAVTRPLRVAILGESNSGKSTLANLFAGGMTLPALPAANTRLPTLLRYAPSPSATALYPGGRRFVLSAADDVPAGGILRLEVGLPSEVLRQVEIIDFPGSANPLLPVNPADVRLHGADAAIWTTVATQAWRESERSAWLTLPQRLRSLGLLAITHCDLVPSADDFQRLRARLETVARAQFVGMFFVAPAGRKAASNFGDSTALLSEIQSIAVQFSAFRLARAVLITRQLGEIGLQRLGEGSTS